MKEAIAIIAIIAAVFIFIVKYDHIPTTDSPSPTERGTP